MIKHDARIGMGYDFKAGGMFEDMSFEKDRTLLQLWDIYRNGYTSDQVLNTIYVPMIVIENGGRVKCKAERCALDDTMISELRARYQGIKEEEMIQREQEELAKYNELHGIQRPGLSSNLLDAMGGTSPKSSRAQSILSYYKGKVSHLSSKQTQRKADAAMNERIEKQTNQQTETQMNKQTEKLADRQGSTTKHENKEKQTKQQAHPVTENLEEQTQKQIGSTKNKRKEKRTRQQTHAPTDNDFEKQIYRHTDSPKDKDTDKQVDPQITICAEKQSYRRPYIPANRNIDKQIR